MAMSTIAKKSVLHYPQPRMCCGFSSVTVPVWPLLGTLMIGHFSISFQKRRRSWPKPVAYCCWRELRRCILECLKSWTMPRCCSTPSRRSRVSSFESALLRAAPFSCKRSSATYEYRRFLLVYISMITCECVRMNVWLQFLHWNCRHIHLLNQACKNCSNGGLKPFVLKYLL